MSSHDEHGYPDLESGVRDQFHYELAEDHDENEGYEYFEQPNVAYRHGVAQFPDDGEAYPGYDDYEAEQIKVPTHIVTPSGPFPITEEMKEKYRHLTVEGLQRLAKAQMSRDGRICNVLDAFLDANSIA